MAMARIMIAAPGSGSGKTLITCGILQALKNRGMSLASFKCGPDYIDPMFHGRVLGIPSKNLDTFFTGEELTRYLLAREAGQAELSVLEGVMGYYDGVAGTHTRASAYDLARVTETPTVLVVDTRGMSLSILPLIKGFLEFRSDSRIAGVIFNRMSPGLYPRIKGQVETELPVKVLGYVPKAEEYVIESRHLGLVTPNEIAHLRERLMGLAGVLEETLDLDGLIAIARTAEELTVEAPRIPKLSPQTPRVRIGIARDEAFCFYYRDNLQLMEEMGAQLVFFSPLWDETLPEDLDGLILYGGYPELYAGELSGNTSMLTSIREALGSGMPYLAECGGFLYLHQELEDLDGRSWPMVGTIKGRACNTGKLGRFGYVTLEAQRNQILGTEGSSIRAHEFHYYDSTDNGDAFLAQKPLAKRSWECIHADETHAAGFPHLYYYSNPDYIYSFLTTCARRQKQ